MSAPAATGPEPFKARLRDLRLRRGRAAALAAASLRLIDRSHVRLTTRAARRQMQASGHFSKIRGHALSASAQVLASQSPEALTCPAPGAARMR
jgi:hypothetical protein